MTTQLSDLLKNNDFNLRVLRGPSQMEIANSLFRKHGDFSKNKGVTFVVEEDGQIDNGRNHMVEVFVTGVEHDSAGYTGLLPDLYIFGLCVQCDGQKIEDLRQFIPVKVFFRQSDCLGRFRPRKV